MEVIEKVKEENTKKEEVFSPVVTFKHLFPALVGILIMTLILALIARYVEFKLGI